ncbi:uncharacterized protein LOC144654935 [Oculina patagonica]
MAKFTASQHFILYVKNAALLLLVVLSLFTLTEGWCSGCEDDQICCGEVCIYGSKCSGYSCSSEWDCSTGETCCNNVCVNGTNCLGQYCSSSSDCSSGEDCCSMKCKSGYGCIGQSCSTNSDCGSTGGVYEYCCGGECGYHDCSFDVAVWIILGSIFGTLFLIIMISLCVFFAYRRRRPAYGRIIEGQRVVSATTVTQSNPPYFGEFPPSYQQGYAYYPPPQYVQYPPYNAGSTKSSEPPPPYSGAPEGRSGGVSTTQNNYGAVGNSSLPA